MEGEFDKPQAGNVSEADLLAEFRNEAAADGSEGAYDPSSLYGAGNEAPAASTDPQPTDQQPSQDPAATDQTPAPTADPAVPPVADAPATPDVSNVPTPEALQQAQDEFAADDPREHVPVDALVQAAEQYPVQSFAFAIENGQPDAAAAVLATVAENDPAVAWGLLLDHVQNTAAQIAEERVAPLSERASMQDEVKNASEAHEAVMGRVDDAHLLAEEAAKIVESKFKGLTDRSRQSFENLLEEAFDTARGRLMRAGTYKAPAASDGGGAPASGAAPVQPPKPVVMGGAAPPVDTAGAGDDPQGDAWPDMEQFRRALGV